LIFSLIFLSALQCGRSRSDAGPEHMSRPHDDDVSVTAPVAGRLETTHRP